MGKALGMLSYTLAKRRRRITEKNIALCFPSLSEASQQTLCKQVFIENMQGLLETGLGLWGNRAKLQEQVSIEGAEHMQQAYESNQGVIMVGAHYSSLDLGGLLFSLFFPVDVIYRPHGNAVFNRFLLKSRETFVGQAIPKNDMRAIIRRLKKGHIFWYPADQDYGIEHSVFAPFFGIPAASITATSRLAKISGAKVIIFACHRTGKNKYNISLTPALENFPTSDVVADTARINQGLEEQIKKYPEQYMWMHRRFKTRPEGEASFY